MKNENQQTLNPETEFKKIKAEIDKVARVQKLLTAVIRLSVTILIVVLLFALFMTKRNLKQRNCSICAICLPNCKCINI